MTNELTLQIIDYNSSGEGVGKSDGFVVFVPFSIVGELVRVKIIETHKSYARAEIIGILESSPQRITPECKHFGLCGGCGLLHMTYDEELRFKRRKVANALRLDEIPIIQSPVTRHYRNKTIWQTDGEKIGLYAQKSHDVIEVENCLLQSEEANKLKNKQLFYRNPKQLLCGLEFEVGEKSFFQINNASAEKMIAFVADNLSPTDRVLDLYCGGGAISLCVARKAASVVGVEVNKQAIIEAIANARRNNIENIEFIAGKSERIIDNIDFSEFDAVILDPPRAGCDKHLLERLQLSGIKKIIYVSCNPATLARDLKRLDNYEMTAVTAVDMFPRTAHVEVVCVLEGGI
ncbi:MAG: 23S rRNA (uracil(1939)-C(5))-methyltransferase RlmD [Oscillospiraceae bacterium]|nr:23S rRNA (uracil(1939)-C(5))-methyltransferase RlmD [Oscillospiraceae bacterium]